jgi:hypothetical protein
VIIQDTFTSRRYEKFIDSSSEIYLRLSSIPALDRGSLDISDEGQKPVIQQRVDHFFSFPYFERAQLLD